MDVRERDPERAAPTVARPEGLTQREAEARRRRGEGNVAVSRSSRSYAKILRTNVFSFFNVILFVIGAALLALGRYNDAFTSVGLGLVNAAISAVQEIRAKRKLDRLQLLDRSLVTVVRDGRDAEVTPEDVRKYNLVLWGDAKSNKLIARMADKLPAQWASGKLAFAGRSHDAAAHVPTLIYPNPQNPAKYVVLNSGLTFREDHDRTNSIQNPKLGDWAIVDVTTPPNGLVPGKVVEHGFFDEAWQPKSPAK